MKQWLPKKNGDRIFGFEGPTRTWKWQMFHSSPGYAETNNPSENTNRKIKHKASKQSKHLVDIVKDISTIV